MPELAVGYFVTKCTSKFRQPANLGLAAILSKAFPILTEINSKSLVGVLSPSDVGIRPRRNDRSDSHNSSNSTSSSVSKDKMEELVLKMTRTIENAVNGPVNTYGFSLFLASRITMLSSIVGVSLLTYVGYDLSAFLESYGVSETIQATGAGLAAATLTNSVLLPLQLYHLPHMVDNVINSKVGKYSSIDPLELYLYILWRSTLRFRYARMQVFTFFRSLHQQPTASDHEVGSR